MADGIHSGVELQESLLYVLPLGAKLIIGKARSEGVGANINGIEAARDASVFCGRVIISFTCLAGSVFSCVDEYANDGQQSATKDRNGCHRSNYIRDLFACIYR